MSFGIPRFALLAFICVFLAGCISAKSFVDPTFPRVSYDDVKRRPAPLRLKLIVEFQRNGEPLPKAESTLRDNADRILRASSVITPTPDGADGEIKIVVNNVADRSEAAAKGFGTGLTFGLVGSTVTDAYEMSVSIAANGKTISRTAIRHAIHTAIGNTSIPPGLEAVPPNVAFQRVLEQMLLRVLQDMQNQGELAWMRARPQPRIGQVAHS